MLLERLCQEQNWIYAIHKPWSWLTWLMVNMLVLQDYTERTILYAKGGSFKASVTSILIKFIEETKKHADSLLSKLQEIMKNGQCPIFSTKRP